MVTKRQVQREIVEVRVAGLASGTLEQGRCVANDPVSEFEQRVQQFGSLTFSVSF